MKKISLILLFFALFKASFSQTTLQPEIGKPCPDFTLDYVTHYPQKKVSLNDFKGKWLFLDFWFMGCASCIESFPKISQLQQEFSDEAQFMMVGCIGKIPTQKNIKDFYEKLRVKHGLDIPVAYDSTLVYHWGIKSMPHIVIINPQGIVTHITNGLDMNSDKIRRLLKGEEVSFFEKDLRRGNWDIGGELNDTKLLYQSILTEWDGEAFYGGLSIDEYIPYYKEKKGSLKFVGANLNQLYNTAYFGQNYFVVRDTLSYGKIYPVPVLEISDTTLFQYKETYNFGKGRYNYSLYIPNIPTTQITRQNIMKYMQQDLHRVFGYNAFVEYRDMPVWNLVAKPGVEKRIRTKGGTFYNGASSGDAYMGFTVRNVSMETFTHSLFSYLNVNEKYPFIDKTGITGNIDFNIDADMMDINDVRKELQKKGLDLVKGKKKMKVLVIRDSKPVK